MIENHIKKSVIKLISFICISFSKSTHPPTNKKPHECGTRLLNAGITLILACDIIPDTLFIN